MEYNETLVEGKGQNTNYISRETVEVINHALLLALPIIYREADRTSTNKTIIFTVRCSQCIPPQQYQRMLTCTQWKHCRRQYAKWLLRTRLEFYDIIANYCYLEIQITGPEYCWVTFRIQLQTKLVKKFICP